ncbi:MAG: DUF6311 domain-containing protein [Bacteroidales bacterium]|nr:DUF6311 domain-containing protein [Bacteroidales bacterium]
MKTFIKKNGDVLCSVAIAILLYCYYFGNIINPAYLDFHTPFNHNDIDRIGDIAQHYWGGVAYRVSEWTWPPFITKNICYPPGTSVLNTDSIPLMAIIFKVLHKIFGLSPLLQYEGLYGAINFILQSIISVFIFRKIFAHKFLITLASCFFIISPPMIARLLKHQSLTSHWIILSAILLYLNDKFGVREVVWTTFLLSVSLFIHPYFFMMIAPIILALVIKKRNTEETREQLTLVNCVIILIILYSSCYILGAFDLSGCASSEHVNEWSINLNCLFNSLGNSKLLEALDWHSHNDDGLNYLGVGLIVLALLAISQLNLNMVIKNKHKEIVLACLLLTLFSLGPKVHLGTAPIFNIELLFLEKMYIFRSVGRFFWPVWYLLVISFMRIVSIRCSVRSMSALLSLLLVVQFIDITPLLERKSEAIAKNTRHRKSDSILKSEKWNVLFFKYSHVFFTSNTYGYKMGLYFWQKIPAYNITVNFGYLTRPPISAEESIINAERSLLRGEKPTDGDDETIYILSDLLYQLLLNSKNSRVIKMRSKIQKLDGIKFLLHSQM